MKDEKKLALRVFRRSRDYLVLLWRRVEGVDPNKTEIIFSPISGSPEARRAESTLVQKFQTDEAIDTQMKDMQVDDDTVICIINEQENGLEPSEPYYVRVKYGGFEQGQKLFPAGVLPTHEQEEKKKNVHHYAWDQESEVWRKVCGVKIKTGPHRGKFALLTVVDAGGEEE